MGKSKKRRKSPLRRWCDGYGHGSKAYLARECAVRWQTIHDIVEETSVPSVSTARAIERATGGEVAWTSLV
jgi:hypothetical protein